MASPAKLLFEALMKEAGNFASYNYRTYAQRRIQDAFAQHRHETDPAKIEALMKQGQETLGMLRRQTTINRMYHDKDLVIEKTTR